MRIRGISRRAAFSAAGALILFASVPVKVQADSVIVTYTYDENGNVIGSTVTADSTPPTAPGTPIFSNITWTAATATWTAATDNVGVAGYDYRLNAGAWQPLGNVLSVNLTGLAAGTSYTFEVRARDAVPNFSSASSGNFATPADTTAPSTPTGLGASAPTSNLVNLSWTASTDNVGVTGYKVFRNGGQIGTSATTSYADNTVAGTTAYSYKVSAYDAATNNSAQSGAVNVTTPDTIAPSTPTGLGATAVAHNQVNLSWSASSDSGGSGLAGYRIHRNGSLLTSVSGTSHADTTVAASTSYNYNVYAYDGASNTSGASNTAPVTTPAAVPSTPAQIWTSPVGVSYGGNFTVLWSASSGPVSYYRLEEDKDGNGSVEFTYTINAPATSKSLAKGSSYKELYYRVQACNASNQCSGWTNQTLIYTCPTSGCP